jgi:transcription elongation factor GreA
MNDVTYLTKEGYERLKMELSELKGKGRTDMAQQIQKAREMGDLSENAEYDAAKEAQGLLELRISKLETTIANARVVDDSGIDPSKAFILSTVKVKHLKMNREFFYTLVAEEEADLKQNKISVKSPVGKALLGHSVGEVVEVEAPSGKVQFEILEISRS